MTRIEDMSEPQRQSWITLLADGAVFVYFWQKMTGGFGLRPEHFEPAQLGGLYLKVIIITIILHAVIAAVFELRKRKGDIEKDERDIEIARRGSQSGYWFMQAAIGAIIVILLIQYVAGDLYQGSISVIKPVEMVFYLAMSTSLADLIKHATIIWAYRRGT